MKQKNCHPLLTVLFTLALAGSLSLTGCGKSEPESGTRLPEAAVNTDVSTKNTKSEFNALVGRWHRPDVGYMLQIRSVAADGTLDVIYSAPRLVQVGKAVATQSGGKVQVVMELADPALAGCKYTLTLDPQGGRLNGLYHQAALNENYDIFFVRQ
jgi:predicted small lipoprotein YifL